MTKLFMRIPDLKPPLQVPGGLAYSDSEKAEALADNLGAQLKPIPVPPLQTDKVERVRETLESFAIAPASEPLLKKNISNLGLKCHR